MAIFERLRLFLAAVLAIGLTVTAAAESAMQECIKSEHWVAYVQDGAPYNKPSAHSECTGKALSRLKDGHQKMKTARDAAKAADAKATGSTEKIATLKGSEAKVIYLESHKAYSHAHAEFELCRERLSEIENYLATHRARAKTALQQCGENREAATRGWFKLFWRANEVNKQKMDKAEAQCADFKENYAGFLKHWEQESQKLTDGGSSPTFNFAKAQSLEDIQRMTKDLHNYCRAQKEKNANDATLAQNSANRQILNSDDAPPEASTSKPATEAAKAPAPELTEAEQSTVASAKYLTGKDVTGTGTAGEPNSSFVKHLESESLTQDEFLAKSPADQKVIIDKWGEKESAIFESAAVKPSGGTEQAPKPGASAQETALNQIKDSDASLTSPPKKKGWSTTKKVVVGGIAVAAVGGTVGAVMASSSNKKKKKKAKAQQVEREAFYKACIDDLSKTQTVVDPVEDCKNWKPN